MVFYYFLYLEHLEEQLEQLHFPLDEALIFLNSIHSTREKIKIVIKISINKSPI